MHELRERLLKCFGAYPSLLAAFSGGVDSTLLAWAAKEAGLNDLRLVFCRTPLITAEEEEHARKLACYLELPLTVEYLEVLDIPEVTGNSFERCYACKKKLFGHLQGLAEQWGLAAVADGTNADDKLAAHRPGGRACAELGIAQPLAAAGLTKAQVRQLAKEAGLPNHDQPARPCLATRFPYDTELSVYLLERVAAGERLLRQAGLADMRLRCHGDICRIETDAAGQERLLSQAQEIEASLIALGWQFVTVDLGGLRSGRFDEIVMKGKL